MGCVPCSESRFGRVITCTSTTRPTGSSLYEGLAIYETDTDRFLIWNGVNWNPPWNMPWGVQGYVEVTGNQGSLGASFTDANSLTRTWTAVANRRYRLTAEGLISSTSAGVASMNIADPSNNQIQLCQTQLSITGSGAKVVLSAIISPAAGSITRKVRVAVSAGTGTLVAAATSPAYLLVEDIGPNGAPA